MLPLKSGSAMRMTIASLTSSTPLQKATLRFGDFMRKRRLPLALAAFILALNCSMAWAYFVVDRSLNYTPVNSVTRAIVHECTASRRIPTGGDKGSYEYLNKDNTMNCEQLRALVQTDRYSGFSVHDSAFVSVEYRSPVDKALYIGKIPLAFDQDPARIPLRVPLLILASKRDPGKITVCCHTRVDWFDTSVDL